jgi:general secretion pathway protein B
MSSILKALKKLEDEKAAKNGQRVDITRDIFGAAQQPASRSRWPFITAAAVGAAALAGAAWLFVNHPTPGTGQPPPVPVSLPRAAVVAPQYPSATTTGTIPAVPAPGGTVAVPDPVPRRAIPQAIGKAAAPKPGATPPRPASPVPAARTPAPGTAPAISANHPVIAAPPAAATQAARPAAPPPPIQAGSAAPLPALSVTGIAYNKDAADRLAVVNGIPVSEGRTVGGTKVEEILPDRVRFSAGQKSFEVMVGRSSQPSN